MLLAPLAANAQLALFSVNGTTEAPVGATYQSPTVAAGDSEDIRLRARNQGTASVTVSKLAVAGIGFTIVQTPSIPFVIAPGNFQDVYVHFAGASPASYSANFQINGISVILVATVVNAAILSVQSPCVGPDPVTSAIDFGRIQSGQTVACIFTLQNKGAQSLTVSTISLAGQGFQVSQIVHTPVLLPSGGSFPFTVDFVAPPPMVYSGSLTVDAHTYLLSGTAFVPTLPTPVIEFDAPAPASGQQRTVSMSLPAPAPVSAEGDLLLSFQSGLNSVTDDPAIKFLANGTRHMHFTINAGETQFLLENHPAIFQTGSTWGTISFSISYINVPVTGVASASMAIPAAPIVVNDPLPSIATSRAGDLDVQVWGYDNTYSTGQMSFTFYDLNGNAIQPGAIQADFTPQFHSFFTSSQAGSAFQMRVSFPVQGDSSQILAVDVQLTNSAGSTTLQHLNFKCAGGTCPVSAQ
jgi:hypothetical protein